jgi:hypothetical protein
MGAFPTSNGKLRLLAYNYGAAILDEGVQRHPTPDLGQPLYGREDQLDQKQDDEIQAAMPRNGTNAAGKELDEQDIDRKALRLPSVESWRRITRAGRRSLDFGDR